MNETFSANYGLARWRRLFAFVLLMLMCGNILVHLSLDHHGHSHRATHDTEFDGHSHDHEHETLDIQEEAGLGEDSDDDQGEPGNLEESTHHDLMFATISIEFHQIAERVGESQTATSDGIFRPLPGPYYPPRHLSASL